jgi:hypothetical protein
VDEVPSMSVVPTARRSSMGEKAVNFCDDSDTHQGKSPEISRVGSDIMTVEKRENVPGKDSRHSTVR